MDETALLLRELYTEPADVPPVPLGFYNKVSFRIVEHERRHAWGLFSPGVAFFRRVAFASLLVLAGLGSYLVMQENSIVATSGNGNGMDICWSPSPIITSRIACLSRLAVTPIKTPPIRPHCPDPLKE
jgi:hypothetical protein